MAQGASAGLPGADEDVCLGTTALHWLEHDRHPRLILGEKCDILWSNPAAEDLFDRQIGLEARGRVLTATDPASQLKLKSLLQNARHGPASVCMEQVGREGWLILRGISAAHEARLRFCLSVSTAGDGVLRSFDHLAECFDLTPAEHRVVQDLLAGHEAEALSVRHGVSIETTRTHIKSIYAKVGVKTREALFARLGGFRA